MTILLPAICVVNLALGILVLSKSPTNWTHRTFTFAAISITAWTFGVFLATQASVPLPAPARLTFAMAALSLFALLLLFSSFRTAPHFPALPSVLIFGILTLIFIALSLTNLIVVDQWYEAGQIRAHYGPFHLAFAFYALASFSFTIFINLRQLRSSDGPIRTQLGYLAFGFLFPGSLAVATNLAVPILFGTSSVSQYGPVFSLLMVGIIAHAIARHRLMDARAAITKSVVYAVSFVISGLALATLILLGRILFPTSRIGLTGDLILSLAAAILFHPIKTLSQEAFNRYLCRGRYDYQRTLRSVSELLARRLTVLSVSEHITEVICNTMRNEWVGIYVKGSSSPAEYVLRCHRSVRQEPGATSLPNTINPDSIMASKLFDASTPVTRPRILELRHGYAEMYIPILDDHGLSGFILIGPKVSSDPYFPQDIDLLSTLANQAGIAIKNAQLYEQVVLIKEYLQNIVATIDSGVAAVDQEGRITMFNRAAARLTGRPADAWLGRAVAELPAPLAEALHATLADRQPRVLPEVELPRPTAPVLPIICSTAALQEPAGELLGAVVVFSDLTPLKELETERRRAERLAYFEALAAGIAHEIKNPLVAIKTFMQLLPRRYQETAFREKFGRIADREIGRMEHLVERLRSLAKPGSRPHHAVDLHAPIADALELLQPRFDEKRITVSWSPGPAPHSVLGDQSELEQLFLNLFINGLEQMEPGGMLTVRLVGREGCTIVEVEDTGPGIREELLAKIFDPFVTTKTHGSGLGLAICATIADTHHARIGAANKSSGSGAVFTIEFPAEAMAATPLNV